MYYDNDYFSASREKTGRHEDRDRERERERDKDRERDRRHRKDRS